MWFHGCAREPHRQSGVTVIAAVLWFDGGYGPHWLRAVHKVAAPAGTSITVLAADAQTVVIVDDGPGIPPAEAQAVFERFRRGQRAAGPGAGLGLAIARQIMERQGGQLLLDSSAARGTRFRLIFRTHNP